MIKKTILLFIFLFLNIITYGQKKPSFLQNIRNYIIIESDTIKVQRINQTERDKLFEIGSKLNPSTQSLLLAVLAVEDFLNKSQDKPQGGSSKLENLFIEINKSAKNCGIYIDLDNYRKEGLYFINHPLKEDRNKTLKEIFREIDLENEKRIYDNSVKRRNDSLLTIERRQNAIKDSIEYSKQKAINEAKNKERRKQEVKTQIAHKKKEIEKQSKNKIKRREDIINKYGLENGEAILNHKVKIGWTKAMCIDSWGKPLTVNRTTNKYAVTEQYVYSLKKYLYFENGVLTAIQD